MFTLIILFTFSDIIFKKENFKEEKNFKIEGNFKKILQKKLNKKRYKICRFLDTLNIDYPEKVFSNICRKKILFENLNVVFSGGNTLDVENKYRIPGITENWLSDLFNKIIQTNGSNGFKLGIERLYNKNIQK